jgi:hypothetical protein
MPLDAARETNDREAAVMFGPAEHVFAVEERDLPDPGGAFRIEQVAAGLRLALDLQLGLAYSNGRGKR